MVPSIWPILLVFQLALVEEGRCGKGPNPEGKAEDGDAVVFTTSPDSSSGNQTPLTTMSPSNGSSTSTSMYPGVTSSVPALRFSQPSNATTCMPIQFQWQVTPPSSNVTNVDLRLLITNEGVHQAAPSWSSTSMQSIRKQQPSIVISRDITDKTALSLGFYNWSAVNVPAGWWYILQASLATDYRGDVAMQSAQFFVIAGPNTTCVYPDISSSPSLVSSGSHSHLSAGALAGTVIGTIVGLTALLGAFALPRLWRRGVPGHQAWKEKHGGLYRLF